MCIELDQKRQNVVVSDVSRILTNAQTLMKDDARLISISFSPDTLIRVSFSRNPFPFPSLPSPLLWVRICADLGKFTSFSGEAQTNKNLFGFFR